jgi:predicted nucleic-acid-binding protein
MPSSEDKGLDGFILLTARRCRAIYGLLQACLTASGRNISRHEGNSMKNGILIPSALLISVLIIRIGTPCAAENMEQIKKEQGAMNAVIEQFARDKNICNDEAEQIRFAISPYREGKDLPQWTDEIRKSVAAYKERYMVNMDFKGNESSYLYCYDGQKPRLLASAPDSFESRKNCTQGNR